MRRLGLVLAFTAAPAFAQVVPASDIPATELEREVARIQALHGVTIGAQPVPDTMTEATVATPEVEATPKTYTVVQGDTLYNIAQRNAITVDNLKAANGLETANISLGQTLLIPSASPQVIVEDATETHALNTHTDARVLQASQSPERPYAVLPGDTLFSIASRACIGLDALKAENALVETAISPGQRLVLPAGHCLK